MRWLNRCLTTHNRLCPGEAVVSPLPKRVIDVTSSPNGNVRLIEVTDEEGPYITLSHCWGPEERRPLRTTLDPDTLSKHKLGISLDKLPQTFRDAVEFTRKMDVRYLWIDSLCIIQDSAGDWAVESSKMADIYRNALLTLAASAAEDACQGLFSPAKDKHTDVALSSLSGLTADANIRIRWPLEHNSAGHPLMRRGWAFQERILCPRVLHFSHNELIWECMEELSCECERYSEHNPPRGEWLRPKSAFPFVTHPAQSPNHLMHAWHTAVSDYSAMKLTMQADMLPAISGIAHIIRGADRREYLAGLWKDNLAWDLSWCTSSSKWATRPHPWRAPTFSWASVTYGRVRFPLTKYINEPHSMQQHFTLLDAACTLDSADDMGRVTDGYLLLSGTLVRMTVCWDRNSNQSQHAHAARGRIAILSHGSLWRSEANFFPDYDYDTGHSSPMADKQAAYGLKLLSVSLPERGKEYDVYLVLREAKREEKTLKLGATFGGVALVLERIALYKDRVGHGSLREHLKPSDMLEDVKVAII